MKKEKRGKRERKRDSEIAKKNEHQQQHTRPNVHNRRKLIILLFIDVKFALRIRYDRKLAVMFEWMDAD